jgi:hypothetical protein
VSNEYVALPEYEDLVVLVEELRGVIVGQRRTIQDQAREIERLKRVAA